MQQWVDGADAIVVGRVSEILPANDYGVVSVAGYSPWLIETRLCGSIDSALIVRLEQVEVLSGEVPAQLSIRLGIGEREQLPWDSVPYFKDGGEMYYYGDESTIRLEAGMQVGGAIYKLASTDLYFFGLSYGQPMFTVDPEGNVRFQELKGSTCAAYQPPLSRDGMPYSEFRAELTKAASRTTAEFRAASPFRAEMKNDDPIDPHGTPDWRALSVYGRCTPADYQPKEPECHHSFECPDISHVCSNGSCVAP